MTYQMPTLPVDKQGNPLTINQRQQTRYQCAPATIGQVISNTRTEYQRGWVIDLSKTGVGILLNRPLQEDQKTFVQITSPTDQKKYEFSAHVIHSTQKLVNGDWVIGLQFDIPLTDDQLELLL